MRKLLVVALGLAAGLALSSAAPAKPPAAYGPRPLTHVEPNNAGQLSGKPYKALSSPGKLAFARAEQARLAASKLAKRMIPTTKAVAKHAAWVKACRKAGVNVLIGIN